MTEETLDDVTEKLRNSMAESIELTAEHGEAYSKIHDVFKDVPSGQVGVVNMKTGDVSVLGDIDQQIATVLYEDQQSDAGSGGASHVINYRSIIDLINAQPPINYGLSIHSELPVAYGYRFQNPTAVEELASMDTIATVTPEYWTEWAKFVNLDHIFKMSIHSLKAMGVLYIEKTYDTAGMNKRGWGIRKMRVLSPDAMYTIVDSKGNILGFMQWDGETERKFHEDVESTKQLLDKRMIRAEDKENFRKHHPGAVFIPRHKIAYATYNAYYDDTVYGFGSLVPLISYSKSKVGIEQRILRMIENSASSFVVFKYGTPDYMVSGKSATKVMRDVTKAKNPKYIVVPFYFDVEPVELGKSMAQVEPYLEFFKDEQLTGLGIPMILLRPGGSGEGAKIQLEAFTRQLKYIQNVVGNIFRTQVFPEVLLGDPTKSAKLISDDPRMYPYLRPSVFHKIPELKWNTIESVADRRLRLDVDAKHGAISAEEYREEIGRTSVVSDNDHLPLIKLQIEQLGMQEEMQEKEMEMRDMEMQHEKEMADMEMKKMDKEMEKSQVDIENSRQKLDMDKEKFELDKQRNKEKERSQSVADKRKKANSK